MHSNLPVAVLIVHGDKLDRSTLSSAAHISSKANFRSPQYILIITPNMAVMFTEEMQSS